MIRLPIKYRIKLLIRKPITRLFYRLSSRKSRLLRIGFVEKLRRNFAPTYEEMRHDIITENGDSVCSAVRELMDLESVHRKVMLPDSI